MRDKISQAACLVTGVCVADGCNAGFGYVGYAFVRGAC